MNRTAGFSSFAACAAVLLLCALPSRAQKCDSVSVGFTALTDLGSGTYKGYQGGLYPGGSNTRPPIHDSIGRAFLRSIVPRSIDGAPDPASGRIVLLSIGMSNATQEFSAFKTIADRDAGRNPFLTIVDGAQGGQTAAVIRDSTKNFWTVIDQRLAQAGVGRAQVQTVWLKEADAQPRDAFPVHAQTLTSELGDIVRILKSRYPNLLFVFFSSRIYAGYAASTLNPEPYAYESGFSIKWLIELQIQGDSRLRCTGNDAPAPWLGWGPYLWSDGERGRADSLKWFCTEFQSDGTHPSNTGRQKVAGLLLQFMKSDSLASPWFLRPGATAVDKADAAPEQVELSANYPNPFTAETTIPVRAARPGMIRLRLCDLLGRTVLARDAAIAKAGMHLFTIDGGILLPGTYWCVVSDGRGVAARTVMRIR